MKSNMKILILLLFPIISLSQTKLDSISILDGKVKLLAPKELSPMPDDMWTTKYGQRPKPTMVLSDNDGEVNLIADMRQQRASEDQIGPFKDFQLQQLKSKRPDLELIIDGVKSVNGKKVGYFKFLTQAVDQKVFNYYFFIVVDDKVLLFTFNCTEKLRKKWESTADKIVESLQVRQ